MAMPQQPRLKRRRQFKVLALVGTAAVLLYVGMNLMVITFVPVLYYFTYTVEVTDRMTAIAIQGAVVSWKRTNPASGFQWLVPIGTTGSDGRLSFKETVQEQPKWVWPTLGHFGFPWRVLEVRAESYGAREVRVSDELRGIPYGTAEGVIRVSLEPANRQQGAETVPSQRTR